eukprot:3173206-Pleurochrysis_carterae.AAC.5
MWLDGTGAARSMKPFFANFACTPLAPARTHLTFGAEKKYKQDRGGCDGHRGVASGDVVCDCEVLRFWKGPAKKYLYVGDSGK